MDNKRKEKFKKALESNRNFLEFIREHALSNDYSRKAIDIAKGSHPSKEMLYDYVLNWADKKIESYVMEHIAICSECSLEILDIMEIERELDDEFINRVDQISLTQKIKNLISDLSLPVYSFPVGALVTRSGSTKHKTRYAIGDSFIYCIPVISDGYLVILQYDANEEIELIYPFNSKDDGFVPEGNKKNISGKVTGPVGKQFFKVFWTSRKVLNTENIDSQNKDSVERALNEYIESLINLDPNDWCETVYEYEVIK
jgi:hypothetical protein